MSSFLRTTAIAGIGATEYTRRSGRSVLDLAEEACRAAATDAGVPIDEVDGIATFSLLGDSVSSQAVATTLGVPGLSYICDLSQGGQVPCLVVMQAAMAVAAGLAENVVVFRALNGRSGARVGRGKVGGPATSYREAVGLTAWPQYQAIWARRFMEETGTTSEDLGALVVTQRAYAERNERAILRDPLTLEGYLEQPYLAEPFRVPDCTTEVDGACALLVTSLERARELRHPPAVIAGAAYRAGSRPGLDIGDLLAWEDYTRNFADELADDLWRSAEMEPGDIDFAEIYDCFSHVPLMGLEGLGLVGRGEAAEFVRGGETGLGGSLPVNTHGGLLCEGYVHGMNTVAEAVAQIQGRGGARQVERNGSCVVTSGAVVDGSALILRQA